TGIGKVGSENTLIQPPHYLGYPMAGPTTFLRHRGASFLFLTAVAVMVGGLWLRPSAAKDPAPYTTDYNPPPSPGDLHWQGAVSCSSAACHGKDAPQGSKGTEYSTFLAVDPHRMP